MCGHLMHQFISWGWFGLNEKMINFPRFMNSNRALNTTIAILYTTIHCFRYTTSHPLNLDSRIWWSMVSNAALKSKNTSNVPFLLSRDSLISLVTRTKAVFVECFFHANKAFVTISWYWHSVINSILIILISYSFSIFICSKVMTHNVIIGKSYGGHLEFMQIWPLMKEGFCPPSKNITKFIIRSPCAKLCGFIPEFILWWESP